MSQVLPRFQRDVGNADISVVTIVWKQELSRDGQTIVHLFLLRRNVHRQDPEGDSNGDGKPGHEAFPSMRRTFA